ncbi:hypothetical protein Pla123a_29520 [Posidoniimonas polymericola]|uniref:NHL repeat protein n=1 Tax=Posidoniimonas polymericola TaxID=2528002 RepID=A0A5C5YMQ0_9BACT|nr:hypothetical protein [Posidoniimonas polymericola]TWT76163.1 hypothetical protein Pla123a_29520 [Posidoniimonas polymericola]
MQLVHASTLAGPRGGALFDMRLAGVAVDAGDRCYTLGDNLVRRYSADQQFEHEFQLPALGWSVCAEGDSVWVGFDGQLRAFSANGEELARIDDHERLGRVTAIAVVDGLLAAADATHKEVHLYSTTGEHVGEMGASANTRGFMIPNGVLDLVADPRTDTVLLAHPQKHRVERYGADGRLVNKWGRFGMHSAADFGGCCNPTNIAAAADGTVAVSEKAPPRIKLYDEAGHFLLSAGEECFDANSKNIDLAFDSRGRLYATDPLRREVHVFQLLSGEEQQQ